MLRFPRTNPRSNPEFNAAEHQRLGRRVAAKITMYADKANRVLSPQSEIAKNYGEEDLAILAMTLEVMGKQITAGQLSSLHGQVTAYMDEGGDIADYGPGVAIFEGISRILL